MTAPGWRLTDYEELAQLGSGSQGQVVLARHKTSYQVVAIKYLAADLLNDVRARTIFRDEARLIARISDPHVARLYGYVETGRGAAIVMEAIRGAPLRQVIDARGAPLTPEAALAILKGSLMGLHAAHSVGVVHRDYKPGNVLVQEDGQSKLIDFGVAVLAGQGGGSGTPAYMAPEQWLGQPASAATDIYAATCVLVECVTGAKPYQAATLDDLRMLHLRAQVPVLQLPEPLQPIAAWGLAKDPAQRLANAAEFIVHLETAASRAYGTDWEKRGLAVLGSITAGLGLAVPLVAVGGALLGSGSGATSSGAAWAGGQGAGHAAAAGHSVGGTAGKGVLAKVGGAKGAAAIGFTAAAAGTAAVIMWPSGPSIGGTSRGDVRAFFTRPDIFLRQPYMPASETPYIDYQMTVHPSTVRAGTKVRMTAKFHARLPIGAKYGPGGTRTCFGEKSKRTDVTNNYGFGMGTGKDDSSPHGMHFYPMPPVRANEFPDNPWFLVKATEKNIDNHQPYVPSLCAYDSKWTDIFDFTVPPKRDLPPGRYLVAPQHPMKLENIRRSDGDTPTPVPAAEVGGTTSGHLPIVRVVD
ncbi:serine/threonine-protein kinase [Actinomadura rayongensis]|uniref:Protein kinase n=1 Tax=Actinomadura rayongensis TaxID=1429076 RepID=A0A6I4W134_9ACTN|nr:serine/threonine-protein kinase [Actinomadura rayongensis]MXQ62978.1 protein kinase [Actinomadura rayongensis]